MGRTRSGVIPKEFKLLNEWTELLGLKDWRITLMTDVEPEDMDIKEADGCTSWEESIKAAIIQIVRPDAYSKRLAPFDLEETLVHELLHLKFCLIQTADENSLQDRIAHQLIDDIARALVKLKNKE